MLQISESKEYLLSFAERKQYLHSYECKDNENFSFSAEYLGFSSKIMFFYEFWHSNQQEIFSKSIKTLVSLSR